MKKIKWASGLILACFLLCIPNASASSAEPGIWPGFRGGSATANADLPDSFKLVLDWDRELGAGYSSLAVSDGLIIALFTAGEHDVMAAFDTASSDERWRVQLADKYAGHDGSDDGPLATPTLDGDRVYALGPKGQLVAVMLADGRELWRVQLDESNSDVPFYGYTSSPLAVDGNVIVLTGGKGGAVTAFDRDTGKLNWSTGEDVVTYQSPIFVELAGSAQVVAVTNLKAYGLDPKTGNELWTVTLTEGTAGQESAHPTWVDGERLLINLDKESLMLRVTQTEKGFATEELWRSRSFANAEVLPVVHDGKLFGFTGRILTAVDPSNGEMLWRSRGAQGYSMSLVDGHLAIVTKDGHLVLALAGGDEYTEVARLKVFERGDYGDPAFAGGRFYVRNQKRLAAITVASASEATSKPDVAVESESP